MLLFLLVATALTWMHFAIMRMEKKRVPALAGPRDLPELEVLGKPAPGESGESKARRPAEAFARGAVGSAQPAQS
jgi:NNP family nitrate/nitrite transporter-like MFS transporter